MRLALSDVANERNAAPDIAVEVVCFAGIERSLARHLVYEPVHKAIVVETQNPMALGAFDQRPQLAQQMRIHKLLSLNIYFRFPPEFRLLHLLLPLSGFAAFVHLCRQTVMLSP